MEVLMKRLRAYKKRLTKIERAESMSRAELNKDQLEALQRKPEVVNVIRELEELLKQLEVSEQEELKETATKDKEIQLAEKKKLTQALGEMKTQSDNTLRQSLRLLYALNNCLPKLSTISIQLTDRQFAALSHLSHILNGTLDAQRTPDEAILYSEETLKNYLEKSSSEFHQGVTFADLHGLIAALLSPPKTVKFGMLGNGSIDAFSNAEEKGSVARETLSRPAIPLNMINFINPSEVL
ncbi:hypothetical protein HDU67_002974 [Dinochytrium kinnereticum]|nr:hypothetical protein HDU67_002974 [Dinochytrium kinnereticum]